MIDILSFKILDFFFFIFSSLLSPIYVTFVELIIEAKRIHLKVHTSLTTHNKQLKENLELEFKQIFSHRAMSIKANTRIMICCLWQLFKIFFSFLDESNNQSKCV